MLDETITTDNILRKLVRPKRQVTRPEKIPIAIAWPEGFLHLLEDRIDIEVGGIRTPFYDCELNLLNHNKTGAIPFQIKSNELNASFEMHIDGMGAHYKQIGGNDVLVHKGRKTIKLVDCFKEDPPHIYFADGDMLVDSELFVLPIDDERPAFDLEKIETISWVDVNIQKEVQGKEKHKDSIQRFMIEKLLALGDAYDVIFDDDGSGETADIVAMRLSGQTLKVELFHCKYSSEPKPGARIEDLYDVCGQAQKSIRWRERPDIFLKHFPQREGKRQRSEGTTRYEKGDSATLNSWINRWQEFSYEFSVAIVQPGYSKAATKAEHLELFASTESLLMDTWGMKLRIITSA